MHETQDQLVHTQKIANLGYWRWDSENDNFKLSPHFATMLGTGDLNCCESLEDYLMLVHPDDRDDLRLLISSQINNSPLEPIEYRLVLSNKPSLVVHQELRVSSDYTHIILGTIQDITQRQASERYIRQLAYNDELTGLASRSYFYKHVDDFIKAAHRHHERFALLFLDLDGFKSINDTYGHDAGDELLKTIAKRLQKVLRHADFVARLSGDEFCILVDNVNEEYGAADAANRFLQEINQPLDLKDKIINPRCSIGIAHYPEDGDDLKSLLKASDTAMYIAKKEGKNRYAFYDSDLTLQAEKRLIREEELRQAIVKQQMLLHYQPQLDLLSGKIVAVEALVRWQHPQQGLLYPNDFIDVMERIGLIKQLEAWVLKTACEQVYQWQQQGLGEIGLTVNISSTHFSDPELLNTVSEQFRESGFTADRLELEITESIVQSSKENIKMCKQLR
ncbi:MAG: diguanylate cyclase, partial [Thiotrichaceae bacterium]|nr:diguanylate cyclase [Thiotrichaceae bacterium]